MLGIIRFFRSMITLCVLSFFPILTLLELSEARDNQEVFNSRVCSSNDTRIVSLEDRLKFCARGEDDEYMGSSQNGGSFAPETCPEVNPSLTALVPGDGQTSYLTVTTIRSDIHLWFYFPHYQGFQFKLIEHDTNEELHPETSFISNSNILSIQINKDTISPYKYYYWSLTVICDSNSELEDTDIYVDGYFYVIKGSSENVQETPAQESNRYMQNGLWNESLTTILSRVCPLDIKVAESQLDNLFKHSNFSTNENDTYINSLIIHCMKSKSNYMPFK